MTSSTAGGLFSGTFARGGAAPEVSDAAWLAAMLDVEAALAGAQAAIGLVPAEVAAEVEDACRPSSSTSRSWASTRPGRGTP